jgi:hypothetical protein
MTLAEKVIRGLALHVELTHDYEHSFDCNACNEELRCCLDEAHPLFPELVRRIVDAIEAKENV